MLLSVIIVNYNVKRLLADCLRSVLASSIIARCEVIVIDNNSSDGSVEELAPLFPAVRFVANSENLGFAKANNLGIMQARGKYILLLNPDTVVGSELFSTVCSFMDNNPDAGAVGVRMIDGTGAFLPESKRGFPTPWVSFCKMLGLGKLFPNSRLFGRYHLRYLNEYQTHKVDVLAGACMFLRRELLDKTGGLDEAFFMYGEDIDLSYRIRQAGYENYYLPETIVHYKGQSPHGSDWRYVKRFYQAMDIFYCKHFAHNNLLYKALVKLGIVFAGAITFLQRTIVKK
ncbi:MAG: glycosyltransferase family 2 protein [Prevotellaceae bacterium]|jgi:GT2 family glycosyltransferase|nr:glycosyltransferase family 2 protein [Prevotellaceae bacterium]